MTTQTYTHARASEQANQEICSARESVGSGYGAAHIKSNLRNNFIIYGVHTLGGGGVVEPHAPRSSSYFFSLLAGCSGRVGLGVYVWGVRLCLLV